MSGSEQATIGLLGFMRQVLVDFKLAVRALLQSTAAYWKTVAALINYQSLIDQLSGRAPDPSTVSRVCGGVTDDPARGVRGGRDNLFEGVIFSRCLVDLDVNAFHNVVFQDSVIRYKGGPMNLSNVRFINCRFVIDVPASAPANPPENRLLFALLNSPSLTKIQLR